MIRIVTDSAADLTAAELSVPGVFVVPLSVTFADGTTQLDDGTMTKDEFFVRLAEDSKLPRTSQPSPASFMQVYEDAAAAGDEVLVITIGQKLSGTYQCAHLAAADVGLQAHIVDSEAASQGEALLVREAVRLRDEEGLTAEEIAVHSASSRCWPCRTVPSSWWTRAAAAPVRWSPCSNSWTRSAVLIRATAIRCSTAIISS